jgi:hypothetical protein
MQDQGRKGHHVEGEPASASLAAAAAGAGADKIEDMATREKRLKRELNKRAAKFMKGAPVRDIKKIADRKTKAHVRYAETLADDAATNAALHEKWLLPSAPGAIEAEGMERTYRFSQRDIKDAVDINAARKAFDLSLPELGPYRVGFTPNGRDLLLGGRRGHLALVRWGDYRLISETQVRETVRDVTFLHSGQFFAAAQKKYVYVYDNRGTEIHCLKDHTEVSRLDFLPLHFLLTSVGDQGVLRYQDTTYGKIGPSFVRRDDAQPHERRLSAGARQRHRDSVVPQHGRASGEDAVPPRSDSLRRGGSAKRLVPRHRGRRRAGEDLRLADVQRSTRVLLRRSRGVGGHLAARHAGGHVRKPRADLGRERDSRR